MKLSFKSSEKKPVPDRNQNRLQTIEKKSIVTRLKNSLMKTRQYLGFGFFKLFHHNRVDSLFFEKLEEQLLMADVGIETTKKIISSLIDHTSRHQLNDVSVLYNILRDRMMSILSKVDHPPLLTIENHTPFVILVVGVNGVGKTTTIGKLAHWYKTKGYSVLLAAGDTFRPSAIEQLQLWGKKNCVPVIAQHTGADAASVIFDAIQASRTRNIQIMIADTAGRLQNKVHLMEGLKKIIRVMKKLDVGAPHEAMLVLDAHTGQNAISQVELFNEAIGLTSILVTKLDGTAKGGVIFTLADRFNLPIRYIGVGEHIEDLRSFKADDFINALFDKDS